MNESESITRAQILCSMLGVKREAVVYAAIAEAHYVELRGFPRACTSIILLGRAAPTKPKSMLVTTSLAINSNFISLHFPELILIRTSMLQRDSLVSHTATRSSEKPKVSRYQKCIMINNPVSSYLGAHTKQKANNTARRHQHT